MRSKNSRKRGPLPKISIVIALLLNRCFSTEPFHRAEKSFATTEQLQVSVAIYNSTVESFRSTKWREIFFFLFFFPFLLRGEGWWNGFWSEDLIVRVAWEFYLIIGGRVLIEEIFSRFLISFFFFKKINWSMDINTEILWRSIKNLLTQSDV